MDSAFFAVFVPCLMFLPFFVFLLLSSLRRRNCPDCGRALPALQSPFAKTRRMWVEGGYRCPNCGCEADLAGRKVAAATGPRRGSVVRGVLLLTPLAVGMALGTYLLAWGMPTSTSPPADLPPHVERGW